MPGSFRTGQKDKAIGRATKRLVKNLDLQKHRLRDGRDFMTWAASQLHQVDLSDPNTRDQVEEHLRHALRRERFDWRRWLLPGISVVVALVVIGAIVVVSQLQIGQVYDELQQIRDSVNGLSDEVSSAEQQLRGSVSELQGKVSNAQEQFKGVRGQIAALSNKVQVLENLSASESAEPTPVPSHTPAPSEEEKATEPTKSVPPQPIQVTGYVYKDETSEGIGQIPLELKVWQADRWADQRGAQTTTAEDGAFALTYPPPDPLPPPLKLQLIHGLDTWNVRTHVEGDGWRTPGEWVEGEFHDPAAIPPVTIYLAIERSFSGQVILSDTGVDPTQVEVALSHRHDPGGDWEITKRPLNADGTFVLKSVGIEHAVWYRVLVAVPDGFACEAAGEPLFKPGAWNPTATMTGNVHGCGLETTGPVTGLAFDGAMFNVRKTEAKLPPAQDTDGEILAGGSWGTETGPGGKFQAGPIIPGETPVKVLGHTLVDDWRLAYEPAVDVFFWAGWYTANEHLVNADDLAELPLIFQPQGQSADERAPSGWSHEIVDGLEVYYTEHTTETLQVTWELEGLEPGPWRLQAWVPKGRGQAVVSYEVFGQTASGGGPLTSIVGSPEIDQSKVDTSQFMDIGVYEVREDVTAIEIRLDASKAQRGELAPETGWTIGVGAIRAVKWEG